jgi:hypothetical protein
MPDRMSLRMSTRDNIGYGIDQNMFDRLVRSMPAELIPQNIDGYFIEGRRAFFNAIAVDRSFKPGIPETIPPQHGHRYVLGIDPAASHDETWALVIDVTTPGHYYGVHAQKRGGRQSIPALITLLKDIHRAYNSNGAQCSSALDSSGFGGKVIRDLLSDIHPLRNVEFGGTQRKKLRILTDMKGLIEQSRFTFPRTGIWLHLRRQLLAYRLDDKVLKTDAVMGLVVAGTEIVRNPGNAVEHLPFDIFDERDLTVQRPDQTRGKHYDGGGDGEAGTSDHLPVPDFDPAKMTEARNTAMRLAGGVSSRGWDEW